MAQNFIERKRQSEGRSYWLTLSEKFHRTFAIRTDDLVTRSRPGRREEPAPEMAPAEPLSDADWEAA